MSRAAYSITASGAVDPDYAITYAAGALTVTPAQLIITADNQTKVYGAALPTLTASYTGFVNGDTSASLTTQPTLTTTATATSPVSGNPYAITAVGAVDPDYSITYVAGTLTVTPAALTITANNQTKAYGAALPALTASFTGFVNGDSSASLSTQPTLTTTATASSHVGNYAITASGAVDSDYSITYVAGSLTVTPAALTITADNQSMAYGAALPTLTASYAGFVNGDTRANLTTQPTLTTTAAAGSHVGNYAITAGGAVDPDYTISYVLGTLTVTSVGLTITADNQTKVYGAELPTLTASYSGFVNGDTSASLATQPTLATTATASSHVSGNPYAITASGAVDPDYAITYVAGTLAVTAAPLLITADNQSMEYGAALPTLTASYSGFVNGDTSASLTTQPTLSTTATANSHVAGSPYSITAAGAVDTDYSISYVAGSLTVTTGAPDDPRGQPVQGLRRGVADPDGQLLRLRQWRHLREPDDSAHAQHNGDRRQPCRGQSLHHHRQRGRGVRLQHQLRRRQSHRHGGAASDHRQQPGQGIRRGPADSDRQLLRLRQRRHLGQPDLSAGADHHRYRQKPRGGQPV